MTLRQFIKNIEGFSDYSPGNMIEYFVYYLLIHAGMDGVTPKDVSACYDELHLSPYSNISSYLLRYSGKGKMQKFIKKKEHYFLEHKTKNRIDTLLTKEPELKPTDNLFLLSIFDNTRNYLVTFAKEATCAYDAGLYNCCFFMIRKLIETLIIELYERHGIEDEIKTASGGYLFLSDLINKAIAQKKWHLTKVVREQLPDLKKLADSSVHSKRFNAKKADLDKIKTDLRIILQELVNQVDYANWKA